MKDVFEFLYGEEVHKIGVRVFDDTPYFCARDMAKACKYTQGLSIKSSDKPIKSGSYNYLSITKINDVLSRASKSRREPAQALIVALQKQYIAAMPVERVPISGPPAATSHDLRIKRNRLEMDIYELRAMEYAKMSEIETSQRDLRGIRAKLYEREREAASLSPQLVEQIPMRVVNEIE